MASKSKGAFAQLRASRAGQKRTDQYKVNTDDKIFDVVDEGVYRKVVANRMLEDDFVEEDGDHGYADNGEEGWDGYDDERMEVDSEEEREARRRAKQAKASSSSKSKKPSKPKPKSKASSDGEEDDDAPAVSIDAYRKPIAPEKESDFLNSLLNDLDTKTAVLPSASSAPKRNGTTHTTKSVARKRKPSMSDSSDGYGFENFNNPRESAGLGPSSDAGPQSSPLKPAKKAKLEEVEPRLGDVTSSDGDFDAILTDEDDAAFADLDFNDLQFEETKPKPTTITKPEPVKQPAKPLAIKPEPEDEKPLHTSTSKSKPVLTTDREVKDLDLEVPSWLQINDISSTKAKGGDEEGLGPLNSSTNGATSSTTVNALEEDGSLRFFWLDYLELDGKLYFVGKVLDRGADGKKKNWVSCCVTVDGIERNLFVRPREFQLDKDGLETDEEVDQDDVYADFDAIRRSFGVKSWAGKWVKRKYVFDDVEEGMEAEQDYLKVVYSFGEPLISEEAKSPNIERIYGTKTSAFELFVLKRKIMGPCWLNIQSPKISSRGVSWCKLEVEVDNPKVVSPFSESDDNAPREVPPLTVMSVSVRTIVNHQTSQREIVSAAARFWKDMNIEDPTPPEKQESSAHIVVRCLDKYPSNFEDTARRQTPVINAVKNEKALLSSLLTVIKTRDPDVIVGHEFLGVYLDVILMRLKQLKVEPWSCIGRFRRSKWPHIGRQGSNIRFLQGRLLCDLASDAAKSMITSTTWSLSEMCGAHLSFNRQDIDPEDTAMYFDSTVGSPDRLLGFVRHCEVDAFLQMALSGKVQMLPLTKQLTSLAGNSWNKTLNGGRAERNEYILLHEFHRLKYICPDKSWTKKGPATNVKAEVKEEVEDGENPTGGAQNAAKPKKDKYKGGLVFEPKRGLWDTFVLVMDFNSLYPSIIQEFNIDFTTVLKAEIYEGDEEKIPDVPADGTPQGVLPRLIATLVNRRKQVKNLMKDPRATESQQMQWDIKQKALKLTANSMYGCLGFEGSRFYARPLAALTTSKGREILTNTKALAESLQLDVVYGDTDSVFVDSKAGTLADALKVASVFKKHVNERYRLLEIDLDAVFQRVLLLQKKKYAAVKVETSGQTSIEIKGLDMKRREYCALSKNVSKQVLDYILSGQPTDVVLEQIHDYLSTVGEDVRSGKISLEDMTIFKRLGKNPEDYDAKGQPHVQVALRMKARGGTAKAGDVIPYLFCQGEHGESSKTGQAERAMHPDEVRRGEGLKIDFEYYLSQQVLPPVERLCDPIEGTDRARIAECLGLDASKFQSAPVAGSQERDFVSFASLISDKDRFRDAEPFLLECKACHGTFEFTNMRFGKAS
ncbi:DNA-directed DNA polymerase alpha catalytic subunit pol1 [Tulasnella sp. 424]|nr:DNA-directed DNA polymerase alpha catalytic subunit pol1 [Tulasnella sp. 424]KAG8974942.1 DNA-directed DNA polymerase alpha catalytic subunit pol1 [Tulasnella sp. 425]